MGRHYLIYGYNVLLQDPEFDASLDQEGLSAARKALREAAECFAHRDGARVRLNYDGVADPMSHDDRHANARVEGSLRIDDCNPHLTLQPQNSQAPAPPPAGASPPLPPIKPRIPSSTVSPRHFMEPRPRRTARPRPPASSHRWLTERMSAGGNSRRLRTMRGAHGKCRRGPMITRWSRKTQPSSPGASSHSGALVGLPGALQRRRLPRLNLGPGAHTPEGCRPGVPAASGSAT